MLGQCAIRWHAMAVLMCVQCTYGITMCITNNYLFGRSQNRDLSLSLYWRASVCVCQLNTHALRLACNDELCDRILFANRQQEERQSVGYRADAAVV